MKRFLALFLCFLVLTACRQNAGRDSSLSEVSTGNTLSSTDEAPVSPAEAVIEGEAPVYIKEALYSLVKGGMLYSNWDSADQLNGSHLFDFYVYNRVAGNYDELAAEYGTVRLMERDWLTIPAELCEGYISQHFGTGYPSLKGLWNYDSETDFYRINSYIGKSAEYAVSITDYTEENNIFTVEYISAYYDGKKHPRIMKAVNTDNGWQYISNGYNMAVPYTEPFPAVNMEKEKLIAYAMTLAEHIVEYGRNGNYHLADVKPDNISRLFMTMYMYAVPGRGNMTDHPYLSVIQYDPKLGGDCTSKLGRAQMMAQQLYGIENWFVPYEGYDYATNTFANPTEIGWGFGPAARDISANYISADKIQVNIFAENVEAEEKYNFTVLFDVMAENNCTFLRFSEMTMQKL